MNQIMLNLINKLCAKCPKEYVDEAFAEFTLQMNEALAAQPPTLPVAPNNSDAEW